MKLFSSLTDLYVDSFGKTWPRKTRRQAAFLILGPMMLTIVFLVAAGVVCHLGDEMICTALSGSVSFSKK